MFEGLDAAAAEFRIFVGDITGKHRNLLENSNTNFRFRLTPVLDHAIPAPERTGKTLISFHVIKEKAIFL